MGVRPFAPFLTSHDATPPIPSLVPLSSAQERLLFRHLVDPTDPAYNVTVAVELRGPLNLAALSLFTATILARHEALRTTFRREGDRFAQQAVTPTPGITLVDLSGRYVGADAALDRVLTGTARHPFDLLAGPPARWILVRLAADRHVLVFAVHHIVFDGASLVVVASELERLYESFRSGRPHDLEPPPAGSVELAAVQRESNRSLNGELSYWTHRLHGAAERLSVFASTTPATVGADRTPITARLSLGTAEAGRLRDLGRSRGCTLNIVVLAGVFCLLRRYTGQDDIVLGSPVSVRDTDTVGVVGMFVNMLPLRVNLSGSPCFADIVTRVRDAVIDGIDHRTVPFEQMVQALQPMRNATLSPLFQVQVVHQRLPPAPRLPEVTSQLMTVPSMAAKYELSITVTESDGTVVVDWEADPGVCDEPTLTTFVSHFQTLLDALVDQARRPLGSVAMLTPSQHRSAVAAGVGPVCARPTGTSLHGLVWERARRSPDAVAVAMPGAESVRTYLTYRELTSSAARLTGRLVEAGVRSEHRVGVFLERSLGLPTALLGILGAGAVFVPLDPDDPPARLAWLLSDAGIRTVLTSQELLDRLPPGKDLTVVDVGAASTALARVPATVHPEQAAYVLYTSGSTGRPKAVVVPHRGIVNRLLWVQEEEPLCDDDRMLHKTPLTFDVSVCELFWPLLAGACVVMAQPGGHRDGGYLASVIADDQVTTAYFVPSLLAQFLNEPANAGCSLPTVERVVVSGEALPGPLRDRFLSQTASRLLNLYGPTEASVDVTGWRCVPRAPVRIGSPITNVEVHTLDDALQPLPAHVPGELYLGGAALARCYLDRPALTARHFVPCPLGTRPGARLYKTGDRARRCPDGALEFLGRRDSQVKIAGNRIELPEIEEALRAHGAVADAAVVVCDVQCGRTLVAFVAPRHGAEVERAELLAHLRARLPAAMVPAIVVVLDELPHTSSGKVDRNALPDPAMAAAQPQMPRIPPRNRVERLVAQAWCATVGLDGVSVHDNFFDVGGNSLLLIDMHMRLQESVDEGLSIGDLFRCPTVASLAEFIRTRPAVPVAATRAVGRARRRAAVAARGSRLARSYPAGGGR